MDEKIELTENQKQSIKALLEQEIANGNQINEGMLQDLAKKFGVPDTLIRDADERRQLIQMAQQMQQQGGLPQNATETLGG